DGIQIVTVVIRSESHKPHFVSGTAASIDGYGAAIEKSFHEAELGLVVMLTKPSKGITNIQDIKSPEDHGLYYSEESQYSKLEFLWSRCDSIESESFGSLDDLIDLYDPVVVDIANKYSRLKVVRVFAEELIPINFGYGNDHFTHHS